MVKLYITAFFELFILKLLGRDVVYPDFTMERTREWWKEALHRFIVKDENIKLDGIFLVKKHYIN
jgi:hypothetical protein